MSRPVAERPIIYKHGLSGWLRTEPQSIEEQKTISDLQKAFARLLAIPSPDDLFKYELHSLDLFDQKPGGKVDETRPQDTSRPLFVAALTDGDFTAVLPAVSLGDPLEFCTYLRSERFPENRDKIIFARTRIWSRELCVNVP